MCDRKTLFIQVSIIFLKHIDQSFHNTIVFLFKVIRGSDKGYLSYWFCVCPHNVSSRVLAVYLIGSAVSFLCVLYFN